jgi:hypothetical protein
MEPAGSGATWTESPKGVFVARKHHKPRQGGVANTLDLFRNGAVGFIDWLDLCSASLKVANNSYQSNRSCDNRQHNQDTNEYQIACEVDWVERNAHLGCI